MSNKVDDFIYEHPIAFTVGGTFALVFVVLMLVTGIYHLSGAAERDRLASFDCKAKGGNELYIKGTGTVCLKTDAIINVR